MNRFASTVWSLVSSTLFSLAMFGLIFPPNVFAQPGVKPLLANAGSVSAAQLKIEVLEMSSASELPELFQLSINGHTLRFEREGDGYWAFDVERPENRKFQKLPDLDDVLRWQIERDDSGFFHAEVPLSQVDARAADPHKIVHLGGDAEEPRLNIDGFFDTETKSMRTTSLLPQGELVDVSISFATIDDATLGLAAQGDGEKAFIIVVPVALILIILGVVVISCAALLIAQGFICDSVCPNGVHTASASCVPPQVTCLCTGPPNGGGPGHCGRVIGSVDVIGLGGRGSLRQLPVKGIQLNRFEDSGMKHHGEPMTYLMAEWALVSWDLAKNGGAGRILASSSAAFSESSLADLGINEKAAGLGTALLVAAPPHDDNSRLVALPELQLTAPITAAAAGQVLVEVDFSEDRQLQGLRVLHDTLGGVSAELLGQLKSSLAMSYASDAQHRAISFALITVGAESRLETAVTYLPKCCCSGVPCA